MSRTWVKRFERQHVSSGSGAADFFDSRLPKVDPSTRPRRRVWCEVSRWARTTVVSGRWAVGWFAWREPAAVVARSGRDRGRRGSRTFTPGEEAAAVPPPLPLCSSLALARKSVPQGSLTICTNGGHASRPSIHTVGPHAALAEGYGCRRRCPTAHRARRQTRA